MLRAWFPATMLSATVTLSGVPMLFLPSTRIPSKLLFTSTRLRAAVTVPDPLGSMAIPSPSLSETSVFDMNSLLEAFG